MICDAKYPQSLPDLGRLIRENGKRAVQAGKVCGIGNSYGVNASEVQDTHARPDAHLFLQPLVHAHPLDQRGSRNRASLDGVRDARFVI